MRKQLLFVLPNFKIGGTAVSTRNLISLLDKSNYDIHVWALDHHGLLMHQYNDVPLLRTSFVAQALALRGWKEEDNIFRRFAAAAIRLSRRHPAIFNMALNYAIRKTLTHRHFHTVIACQEGIASRLAALIPSCNHVAWVRCDYQLYFQRYLSSKELFYYHYQHIVCVSHQTTNTFLAHYPDLLPRVATVHNPQNVDHILSNATIDDHDPKFSRSHGSAHVPVGINPNTPTLLSVGRFGPEKRFPLIPSIASQLKARGLNFLWFIVGDGDEKSAIQKNISLHNVADCVILLGAKSNPHFYIKQADLLVSLSSSEACPRVIIEALILGTPVLSSNFPSIYEYLDDGLYGRIAPIENFPDAIAQLLTDKPLYNRLKSNLKNYSFDNTSLIKQLEAIF